MRVGQLIQAIPQTAGGTTTAFLGTLDALSAAGLEWRAFTQRPEASDPVWGQANASLAGWTFAQRAGGVRAGDLGTRVAAAVARGEIDVLHIHGVWCADYLVAARACRRAGVSYVWQPHGMLLTEAVAQKRWKKEVFLALGGRAAIRGASAVLFVTQQERDHSPLPAGSGRREVVPLAVEMPPMAVDAALRARARTRFGLPADAPVVCFMGRLHAVKRVEMLVEAMVGLSHGGRDAHLLIIGGGEADAEARLGELARRLGVSDRVKFAGWVRGEDKWLALAAGDVLSLQSVHENFGFVAVEALGVGTLPVLTENLSLAGELSGVGLCVVGGATPAELRTAIGEGLDRQASGRVLQVGAAYVAANYSGRAIGGRLKAVYAMCSEDRRRASAGAGGDNR